MQPNDLIDVPPSARRLTESLRDIGYDFASAVADLLDNSVAAGATRVCIDLGFEGTQSWVRIADDGTGMTPSILDEAMRFGTRRAYGSDDLGRFGLGLKTASLSQCRIVTVATRAAPERRRIHVRELNLDLIATTDRWAIRKSPWQESNPLVWEPLTSGRGTVVLWRHLDRVLNYQNPNGGWARRRFDRLADDLRLHLGMVFHRFIDGEIVGRPPLQIHVNGEQVESWDPFARRESATVSLPGRLVTVDTGEEVAEVAFKPYVLPHRSAFSSPEAFERLSGPSKWNRQQGLYIYRAGRLIQSGGWSGIRAIDEHTKFARAAIEFDPLLDDLFAINVAKMRITLPPAVRTALEQDVSRLCREALVRYRRGEVARHEQARSVKTNGSGDLHSTGIALIAAALEAGELDALSRIASILFERVPETANRLGLSSLGLSSEHSDLKAAI